MLKDLIGKAKKQGIDAARYESILKKCVKEVATLDHMGKLSGKQSPSSLAEKNRLVILELINELHEKIK